MLTMLLEKLKIDEKYINKRVSNFLHPMTYVSKITCQKDTGTFHTFIQTHSFLLNAEFYDEAQFIFFNSLL